MQFIRLPKAIDIAERVLPELVADWMNTKSMQNINDSFVQKLQVNMQISWVIKWLNSWMPYRRTFRNFTHWAWAIWDLSNHDLFWIISNPGSQKRITLSLESTSTIPFQARASDVKIPEWGQHFSNCRMPYHVSILGTSQRTGDQPNKNVGAHCMCTADIVLNITEREQQPPHQQNLFLSLEASRSAWEDVECKLRCVNFRRVSDLSRAILPAVRVTGSTDRKPGSTWERRWPT